MHDFGLKDNSSVSEHFCLSSRRDSERNMIRPQICLEIIVTILEINSAKSHCCASENYFCKIYTQKLKYKLNILSWICIWFSVLFAMWNKATHVSSHEENASDLIGWFGISLGLVTIFIVFEPIRRLQAAYDFHDVERVTARCFHFHINSIYDLRSARQ